VYSLVGCRECDALWVVLDRPETTTCPRCETRHPFDRLKRFAEDDDETVVREARTQLLAARQGDSDAVADLDHYEQLGAALEESGIDEAEYLDGVGVDTASLDAATTSSESTGTEHCRDIVLRAVRELDAPTADAVVTFASQRDVSPERARELLKKLVRAGEVSETDGEYRAL